MKAADDLAADPDVAELLSRVPFTDGQRLVAIGESSTADRQTGLTRRDLVAARLQERTDFSLLVHTARVVVPADG
jgi:hypothetical protein